MCTSASLICAIDCTSDRKKVFAWTLASQKTAISHKNIIGTLCANYIATGLSHRRIMKRFSILVLTACILQSAVLFTSGAMAKSMQPCTDASIHQRLRELPVDTQKKAEQIFAQYVDKLALLLTQERIAKQELDAALQNDTIPAQELELKTQQLIERQSAITRERVAFRVNLAKETGLKLFYTVNDTSRLASHENGCVNNGDCFARRANTGN